MCGLTFVPQRLSCCPALARGCPGSIHRLQQALVGSTFLPPFIAYVSSGLPLFCSISHRVHSCCYRRRQLLNSTIITLPLPPPRASSSIACASLGIAIFLQITAGLGQRHYRPLRRPAGAHPLQRFHSHQATTGDGKCAVVCAVVCHGLPSVNILSEANTQSAAHMIKKNP